MDNHLAALWCWGQHLEPNQHFGLFHIDAHYDTSGACDGCCYDQRSILCNLSEVEFAQFEGLHVLVTTALIPCLWCSTTILFGF